MSNAKQFLFNQITGSDMNIPLEKMKLKKFVMMSIIQEDKRRFNKFLESEKVLRDYCYEKINEVINGQPVV